MKILGWVEHTECECCGRTDLVRALAVLNDDGVVIHFGSDCARTNLGLASTKALKAAVTAEFEAAKKLDRELSSRIATNAKTLEAARLIEEARAAKLPYSERPARIKELQAEAILDARATFTVEELGAIDRLRSFQYKPS